MKEKRWIITSLIVFPLLVGMACRLSLPKFLRPQPEAEAVTTPEGTVPETSPEPLEEPIQEALPVESEARFEEPKLADLFWVYEEGQVFVVFFFENPNENWVFEELDFTISALDATGEEIASAYDLLPFLYPSERIGMVITLSVADDSVAVDDVILEWSYASSSPGNGRANPFSVDKVTYWENNGFPLVTGLINNEGNRTITDVLANLICFNAAGEITGGGTASVSFVPANDNLGFSGSVELFGEVASVEVYPQSGAYATIHDDEVPWSEISILQDNFYEDEFGFIDGGLLLQNNTDVALKTSYIQVTFYDAQGNVTTTATDEFDMFLPNETLGIAPWVYPAPEGVVTTEYDVLVLPGAHADDYELARNPFVVNDVSLTGDNNEYAKVSFTNTYDKAVRNLEISVLLFDANGTIIRGGNNWYPESTPPGGASEAEVWVGFESDRAVDRIEVWVYPNLFTEFE